MTHTDKFAAFHARKAADRAKEVKVTWRKVSDLTGGGWSGLGPGGALVFVKKNARQGYEYGHRQGKRLVRIGERTSLSRAKEAAASLMIES